MNAVLGTTEYGANGVISQIHPPVLKTMKAKTANGILAAGLLVAKDGSGDLVAYDPAGDSPLNTCVGVLAQDIDTATDDAAVVVCHGTVMLSKLKVGAVTPDDAAIGVLEAMGIYPVSSM